MNRKYLTAGFVCAALAVFCLLVALGGRHIWHADGGNPDQEVSQSIVSAADTEESSQPEEISSSADTSTDETPPYESPIDFASLQAVNPDVYAWLDIPDTAISYPVLQHPEDDAYYLRRNIEGKDATEGVLFTEKTYNSTDFTDPATIIYGHQMKSGTMFGTLQQTYSDPESFAQHQEIVVYLPESEKHYTVFAAVPYDKWHILYNYDFSNSRHFWAFLDTVFSTRSIDAVFAEDVTVEENDHLLILSTCLKGNSDKRYLVLAKLQEDELPV